MIFYYLNKDVYIKYVLCHFGYTPLLVSLKSSTLSPCVCVKILCILKKKKKKKNQICLYIFAKKKTKSWVDMSKNIQVNLIKII